MMKRLNTDTMTLGELEVTTAECGAAAADGADGAGSGPVGTIGMWDTGTHIRVILASGDRLLGCGIDNTEISLLQQLLLFLAGI